jgi:hypothetical protein
VVSSGNNVLESPCIAGPSVIGRVSVADTSLSLSLSLWRRRLLAASALRRGKAAGAAGFRARPPRLGHSRVRGALPASCSSAVGSVPAAVLSCPRSRGSRVDHSSRRGIGRSRPADRPSVSRASPDRGPFERPCHSPHQTVAFEEAPSRVPSRDGSSAERRGSDPGPLRSPTFVLSLPHNRGALVPSILQEETVL